ncbi:hypothetical protein C8R47DRAFT_57831 [Mycena vitilis]|nr:hypothetical protein C8R47DRAFT_57831 [Mycena vitilis]
MQGIQWPLLLDRGADIESHGHYGTPLAFAVRRGRLDVVRFLLGRGADASVTAPLCPMLDGHPSHPCHRANLLYIVMDLRHRSYMVRHRRPKPGAPVSEWTGLPLHEQKKRLIAILLANGASKDTAMETISRHLAELAEAAGHSEQEYFPSRRC